MLEEKSGLGRRGLGLLSHLDAPASLIPSVHTTQMSRFLVWYALTAPDEAADDTRDDRPLSHGTLHALLSLGELFSEMEFCDRFPERLRRSLFSSFWSITCEAIDRLRRYAEMRWKLVVRRALSGDDAEESKTARRHSAQTWMRDAVRVVSHADLDATRRFLQTISLMTADHPFVRGSASWSPDLICDVLLPAYTRWGLLRQTATGHALVRVVLPTTRLALHDGRRFTGRLDRGGELLSPREPVWEVDFPRLFACTSSRLERLDEVLATSLRSIRTTVSVGSDPLPVERRFKPPATRKRKRDPLSVTSARETAPGDEAVSASSSPADAETVLLEQRSILNRAFGLHLRARPVMVKWNEFATLAQHDSDERFLHTCLDRFFETRLADARRDGRGLVPRTPVSDAICLEAHRSWTEKMEGIADLRLASPS